MSDVGLRKKRLETDTWERHRDTITNLYLDLGQPLDQVMIFMKANHNFEATEQAYKKKLRRWRISKNIPAPVMEWILTEMDNRQARGKDSVVFWHDRPVDTEKIERSRQRVNREKRENPHKMPPAIPSNVMRLIRIETPQLKPQPETRQQVLPLRLDIPNAPPPVTLFNAPMNLTQNPSVPSIPSFVFTQPDQPLAMDTGLDLTPASATSSASFFDGDGQITTTQVPLSPILAASDLEHDILETDPDFDQLKSKLEMADSTPEVKRALQRGNKLLQAGSALLPRTNLESMDVNRVQNQEAVAHYRSVLGQHSNGADATAIADALRHISQIQANSSLPDHRPEASLADRERLLAGFHFMFGGDSPVYLRQVFDFCDKGRASTNLSNIASQVAMFKSALQKTLSLDLSLDKTDSILFTANTYFERGLLTQAEVAYFFSQVVMRYSPPEWWKRCENVRFAAQAFLKKRIYSLAEPYLLNIMKEASTHMMIGDFFEQDQYACFMFETLSNHIWTGSNPDYLATLLELENGLRTRQHPSKFDCLELTCWILLAAAFAVGLRGPIEIITMLNEANLESREDRPAQVTWHFVDGITSALQKLELHLRNYGHEEFAQYVRNLSIDIGTRWAKRGLYAGA